MTATLGVSDREAILIYASNLVPSADKGDPVKISAAALPLLEWAEQAEGEDDLRARLKALRQQHRNNCAGGRESGPAGFVDDAGVLYAFLAPGVETECGSGLDDVLRQQWARLRERLAGQEPGS